jgi:Tfp pilus assembly protein PilV
MKLRRGFSLIETMIAVFALSFTVLVFGAVFPTGSRLRQKGSDVTTATILAQQKLEQVRGISFNNLTYSNLLAAGFIDSGRTSSPYTITGVSGLASVLPSGTGTLAITDASADLKQATVTITWGGVLNQNSSNTVTLVTYIASLADSVQYSVQ